MERSGAHSVPLQSKLFSVLTEPGADSCTYRPGSSALGCWLCFERAAALAERKHEHFKNTPHLTYDQTMAGNASSLLTWPCACALGTGVDMESTKRAMRGLVSKKKKRFQEDGYDLDLTYITPRIIAMGFPSAGAAAMYRNPLPEVQRFFNTRHPGHYRLYNLCSERWYVCEGIGWSGSQRNEAGDVMGDCMLLRGGFRCSYSPDEFDGQVVRFPFDDHNPCPLHVIGDFCKDVDAFLGSDKDNVVAIHCKAGKVCCWLVWDHPMACGCARPPLVDSPLPSPQGRTGLMISAYLVHSGICKSSPEALEFFAVARTANSKGVTIPRYTVLRA